MRARIRLVARATAATILVLSLPASGSSTDAEVEPAHGGDLAAPAGTPRPLALTGSTLIDGTGAPPVADSVVILRGGAIECAGTARECAVPEEVKVLDLRGTWITPGLIDAHVHFSQTGWADGRPDSLDVRDRHPYEKVESGLRADPERFLRAYLCAGVTAVFDVGGYPWTWDLARRSESDTLAPRVAATGPLLSTIDPDLNLPAERQFVHLADESVARGAVRYVAAHRASAVKIWFIVRPGLDFETSSSAVGAAADEARTAGLPLVVHATGLREAKAALRAGARLLVHSVWDVPVDEEFLDLAKRAGAIYCPTLTVKDGYARMYRSALSGRPPAVDDPGGCVDSGTLERVAETASLGAERVTASIRERLDRADETGPVMAANLKSVRDAGIVIAMGTDAGNPLTLHGPSVYAEMEAMQASGLSPMEVLVSATRGAAAAMGRLKDLGTVQGGKAADLLVLEADPAATIANVRRIRYVVRGGVLRTAAELKAPRP